MRIVYLLDRIVVYISVRYLSVLIIGRWSLYWTIFSCMTIAKDDNTIDIIHFPLILIIMIIKFPYYKVQRYATFLFNDMFFHKGHYYTMT